MIWMQSLMILLSSWFFLIGVCSFISSPSKNRCAAGYHGFICTDRCRYPWYGKGCKSTCRCLQEICDHVKGCRQLSKGCPSGYTGKYCDKPCDFPHYGKGCQHVCTCSQQRCSVSMGCQENDTGINNQETVKRVPDKNASKTVHSTTSTVTYLSKDKVEEMSLMPERTTVEFSENMPEKATEKQQRKTNHSFLLGKMTSIKLSFIVLGVFFIMLLAMYFAVTVFQLLLQNRREKKIEVSQMESHDVK